MPFYRKYREAIWHPDFIDRVSPKKAEFIIPEIYYRTPHPTDHHSIDEWVSLLGQVGKVAGTPDAREMTLFRGAPRYRPHGLSWTPFYDLAAEHAGRVTNGAVFATRVSVPEILHLRATPIDRMKPVEMLVDSRPHTLTVVD